MPSICKQTKRVKIVTGFRCNAECIFCYYQDRLRQPDMPYKTVVRDLDYAYLCGIREVDFSGGEPTIHPRLKDLIAYARAKGFKKICVITNGIVLSNRKYYKGLVDAGLTETLFSVQGSDAASHESFVKVPGSFSRLVSAMKNAAELGLIIRTNTVVHKQNYKTLGTLCSWIADFHPVQVNFIVVNDWQSAGKSFSKYVCSYTEVAPYLKAACDALALTTKNINVRYIPFCMMQGYEKYVCDQPQLKYDPYEWLPRVRVMLEKHYRWYLTVGMFAYGMLTGAVLHNIMRLRFGDAADDCIVKAIQAYGYRKGRVCKACAYDGICDGVEKTYAKLMGFGELKAVAGAKITKPYYFRTHLFDI